MSTTTLPIVHPGAPSEKHMQSQPSAWGKRKDTSERGLFCPLLTGPFLLIVDTFWGQHGYWSAATQPHYTDTLRWRERWAPTASLMVLQLSFFGPLLIGPERCVPGTPHKTFQRFSDPIILPSQFSPSQSGSNHSVHPFSCFLRINFKNGLFRYPRTLQQYAMGSRFSTCSRSSTANVLWVHLQSPAKRYCW